MSTEPNAANTEELVSPSDKLQDDEPAASPVPGAQNPASEEVKQERGPNTE